MPGDTEALFPLFDRAAARLYWDRAVAQQLARRNVYLARTRLHGAALLVRNLLAGTYREVQSNRFRLRAFAKDILQIFRSSRPPPDRQPAAPEKV